MARRSKGFDDRLPRAVVSLVGAGFLMVVFFPKVVERLFLWTACGLLLVAVVVFGAVGLKAWRKNSRTSPGKSQGTPGSGGEILRRWLEENKPESLKSQAHTNDGEQGKISKSAPGDDSRYVQRNPSIWNAPSVPTRGTVADSRSVRQTSSDFEEIRRALRALDWYQFEKLITLYYQAQGFAVQRVGGAKPDGGVDLILEHENQRYVIQCKHWKKWTVGVRQMREFLGTMTDTGIPNGIYVTTCGYTDEARDFASKHGIQLFDESQVVQCVLDMEATQRQVVGELLADRRKFCPRCENEMVLRVARKGSNAGGEFWGCSRYPRCKYILNADEKE